MFGGFIEKGIGKAVGKGLAKVTIKESAEIGTKVAVKELDNAVKVSEKNFAEQAVTPTKVDIFRSFSSFKRTMGVAGTGKAWHHIVEQTPQNIAQFGNYAIHNTQNLVKLPHGAGTIHAQVSGYYSSIRPFTNGQTVRKWLSNQSYQAQYDFGIQTLKNFGWAQ